MSSGKPSVQSGSVRPESETSRAHLPNFSSLLFLLTSRVEKAPRTFRRATDDHTTTTDTPKKTATVFRPDASDVRAPPRRARGFRRARPEVRGDDAVAPLAHGETDDGPVFTQGRRRAGQVRRALRDARWFAYYGLRIGNERLEPFLFFAEGIRAHRAPARKRVWEAR